MLCDLQINLSCICHKLYVLSLALLNMLLKLNTLYKENSNGWNSLRDEIFINFLFFKMNYGPLYLSTLLPPHVGDVSSQRLRNAANYAGIHANTRTYVGSFLPSALQAWNNLPESFRSSNTLATFKRLQTFETP